MKFHRIGIALALVLLLDSRAARAQAPGKADELVDRIVGMAMARGGAQAFLQRLTDSIGRLA